LWKEQVWSFRMKKTFVVAQENSKLGESGEYIFILSFTVKINKVKNNLNTFWINDLTSVYGYLAIYLVLVGKNQLWIV